MDIPKGGLFVVWAKELPHKGYLCNQSAVKHWIRAIETVGNTPEVMKIAAYTISPDELGSISSN